MGKRKIAIIETFYRFRVDVSIKATLERQDELSDYVFKLERDERFRDHISVNNTSGGPAWTAYLIAESDNLATLEAFKAELLAFTHGRIGLD